MIKFQPRRARWIEIGTNLALAAPLWALWACSAPAARDEPAEARPSTRSQPGPAEPAGVSPMSAAPGAAGSAGAAFEAAPADLVAALAGQVGSSCGAALDNCAVTDGCEDIVACAAEHACTGLTCYCADTRCELPGPCRAVIDGAPGAGAGAAPSLSRGPAADAAAAVGVCIESLVGAPSAASDE